MALKCLIRLDRLDWRLIVYIATSLSCLCCLTTTLQTTVLLAKMKAPMFTAALLLIQQLLHFSAVAIPLSEFYPFGAGTGDETLSNNDDDSRSFTLSSTFPFFGVDHSTLHVSLTMMHV